MNKNNSLDWEQITAIASMFVAVLALLVSVWSGVETRDHNYKSMQPILEINRKTDAKNGYAQFSIVNLGPGLAKIKKPMVTVFGVSHSPIGIPGWVEFERRFTESKKDNGFKPRYLSFSQESYLKSGEAKVILDYSGLTEEQVKLFIALDAKLSFEIPYCSVYDECWVAKRFFDKKSMRWESSNEHNSRKNWVTRRNRVTD